MEAVIAIEQVAAACPPRSADVVQFVQFGVDGIGSVLIERGTSGFSLVQPSAVMSDEEWCELHFADCLIPAENVLLGPGGFKKQMASFNGGRLGNTARSQPMAAMPSMQRATMRRRGSSSTDPFCEFQGLQWTFAEWRSSSKAPSFYSTRSL